MGSGEIAKKKVFIAYKHTGQQPDYLERLIGTVWSALEERGLEVSCTLRRQEEFSQKKLSAGQVMGVAFGLIKQSDALLVIQDSNEKSEGMILEVGFVHGYQGMRKIPIIVARFAGINGSYLNAMADLVFDWTTLKDLAEEIASLDLNYLFSKSSTFTSPSELLSNIQKTPVDTPNTAKRPSRHYSHCYPGSPTLNGGDCWASKCIYGCGCSTGPVSSNGPPGIDPFGECPKHPELTSSISR